MDLFTFIKELGLPSALALLVIWYVVIPLKDSHVEFIRSLKVSMDELAKNQTVILMAIRELSESQTNLTQTLSIISKAVEQLEKRTNT